MTTWKASDLRPSALFDNLSDDEFRTRVEAGNLLEGTNVTYSSGRGHAVSRLLGTFSGTTGGFHGLYSRVDTSGVLSANAGVVGVKSLVVNTVAQTLGNLYGGQSIAKHSAATGIKVANAAPVVGFEAVAYQSGAGQAGTMIGLSAVIRADGTPDAYDGGAVHRGIQITMDYPGNVPSEISALTAWNMSGAQTNVLNVVNSGSGFTNFVKFTDDGAPASITNGSTLNDISATANAGWIKVTVGSTVRYIPLYAVKA